MLKLRPLAMQFSSHPTLLHPLFVDGMTESLQLFALAWCVVVQDVAFSTVGTYTCLEASAQYDTYFRWRQSFGKLLVE